MQSQDKELYLKTIAVDIVKFKMRLNNSSKAKKIINEAFKRINELSLDKN
jgi:hypothetical protein